MPRAPEVEFFVAPFLLSFLPFFAGKSAIFIAKSDRAGNASGRGSGKKRQCSEGQIPGRHRGGLTPLLYFKNPLVRLVQFAYKNVTHAARDIFAQNFGKAIPIKWELGLIMTFRSPAAAVAEAGKEVIAPAKPSAAAVAMARPRRLRPRRLRKGA